MAFSASVPHISASILLNSNFPKLILKITSRSLSLRLRGIDILDHLVRTVSPIIEKLLLAGRVADIADTKEQDSAGAGD